MSIVKLDLDALVKTGKISAAQAETLATFSIAEPKSAIWMSTVLIFGALGVAAGVLALEPSAIMGLLLALTALGIATWLKLFQTDETWTVLGSAFALMGTIGLSGWVAMEAGEDLVAIWPQLVIFGIMTAGALVYRSSFLAALAVLALAAVLGTGTFYWHASYALIVREPTVTITIFSTVAGGLYALRPHLSTAWQSLTTVAARTAVFLTNFGFWVGSLWGDHLGEHWVAGDNWSARYEWRETATHIPELVFSLGWAACLIALFVKAPRGGFLSTSALVFFAIHAYTQFFETFADDAVFLIVGGFMAIGVAVLATRLSRTSDMPTQRLL